MSSKRRVWSAGDDENAAGRDKSQDDEVQKICNGEVQVEDGQDSNSSTSSDSSTLLREVKSAVELPAKTLKNSSKKFKHFPYKMPRNKYRTPDAVSREKPVRVLALNQANHRPLQVTPEGSSEHIPRDCHQIRQVGNPNSQDPFVCTLYITSCNTLEGHVNMNVSIDSFADTLNTIASGSVKIEKTLCGILVAFTKENDADKVIKLPLQNIFGGQVQVAKFSNGEYKFRKNVIIKDVPWCISNLEIQHALKMQGIEARKVTCTQAYVKVEVHNALDMYRLVEEGLNFFNYVSFPAVPESAVNLGETDIIQCFKCQGFWHTSNHCRQRPRCVRCGENHDVQYCPRPRNDPICCHCGGPHHAAYKMCPVRLQHINSIYVGIQLAKDKPLRSFPQDMP